MESKESYIIVFKLKEKRADKKADKQEILEKAIKSRIEFLDAGTLFNMPHRQDTTKIGLDVNEYEAPILVAPLAKDEVSTLKRDPNVASVEKDAREVFALHTVEGQERVTAAAETVPWGVDRIRAPLAWDITKGKGVKVAVVDTGIDFTHPDIVPNYKGGISFDPSETSPRDFNRHGTHVAGTIAAAMNDAGVIGVAPSAYLYAVKVLSSNGSGNWSWLIAGLEWCINNGMQVVNMSLGGSSAPTALQTMCDLAWSKGLILVAAAGNSDGSDTSDTVGFPAKYKSVIAVSNITDANTLGPSSSRGPKVELCAPGTNILSTVPGGGHSSLTGTSMASPHVAGAPALALSTHRWPPTGLSSNTAIRRLLALSADNLGVPGRDRLFGFGRVDAEEAAFSLSVPSSVPWAAIRGILTLFLSLRDSHQRVGFRAAHLHNCFFHKLKNSSSAAYKVQVYYSFFCCINCRRRKNFAGTVINRFSISKKS